MSLVPADSFVIGMVTCSLFNSKCKDGDKVGLGPLQTTSQEAASCLRASCLLLEHVNGVFVLHLQLAESVRQAQREGKAVSFLAIRGAETVQLNTHAQCTVPLVLAPPWRPGAPAPLSCLALPPGPCAGRRGFVQNCQ